MVYGYARVSTVKQLKGNSLEDQEQQLIAAGAEIVIKEQFTGTKVDRPEFAKLLNALQPGDKLIVTKLDRFARTAVDGGKVVQDLHERGVIIQIMNMGVADNTPMGKLMVNMLLAFAEFERDMIVERTQTGKAVAKQHGVKVDGRPNKFKPEQIELALNLLETKSYSEVEKMTGISKSTLIRANNKRKSNNL